MALSPDGAVLVLADMGNNRVLLLDPSALTLQGIIGADELSLPHDVTFDAAGRLLVADSGNDRIAVYALNLRRKTARLIETIGNFDGPQGIAVGPDGDLYIAATLENRIVRVRNGKIIASVRSALGLALKKPHDLELDTQAQEPTLIVTDPGNSRLVAFDLNLNAKFEITATAPPLAEPQYISIDDQGRLFVADQFNNAVRVFKQDATLVSTFAHRHVKFPGGVLVDGDRVWVSDTDGGRVLLYRFPKIH